MEEMTEQQKLAKAEKELRDKWWKRIKSVYDYTKDQFDKEAQKYVSMYKHEFSGILPERFLSQDRLDVNVVYPLVKTLIPNLYFQNPKVFVKCEEEKIVKPVMQVVTDENGQESEMEATTPEGELVLNEYEGARSALIFQSALNSNIDKAKIKYQVKQAILDAHLSFYGAVKCGWGNEQGVASMGDGAPPSPREDVFDDLAYAIRLKPWDVVVDLTDFYNPKWIAIRYTVRPDQLKADKRLRFTQQLVGKSEPDKQLRDSVWKHVDSEDLKQTEYFEVYVKPCAEYPNGLYFMISDEVSDGFLFLGEWPLEARGFPIKLLFFNPDPNGGLPIPDVRYYAAQQKAKLNIRNAEYEYVQRTIPIFVINTAGAKDPEKLKKEIERGQIPRVVAAIQPPQKVAGGVNFPSLNFDFRQLEGNIDLDISKTMGIVSSTIAPAASADNQLASALKIADRGEQIRQNERSDIVSDFLQGVIEYWAKLYQEFAGPENYTTIDGEKFPIRWSRDEINGKFVFKIKPFSMNYEDPVVRRRQWVDLLNLLAAPEVRTALQDQGAFVDVLKVVKRVLETYDERDVESFVIDDMAKPENQVMMALQENEAFAMGQPIQVQPTDNNKVHILLHSLQPGMEGHIMEHQGAMMSASVSSVSGGGNEEGLPVNGVAVSQEQMKQPLTPNATNKKVALEREATR